MSRLRFSGRCNACGYMQDLRRDGTLGMHHIWIGHDYRGACPGVGMRPEDTTRRLLDLWLAGKS